MPLFHTANKSPAILFGFALFFSACGAEVVVNENDPTNERDASVDGFPDATGELIDAGLDADIDADADVDSGPAAPPQCLCPNAPGYAPCVKPFQCCPVVAQCKDPASFNCTGSTMMCPP